MANRFVCRSDYTHRQRPLQTWFYKFCEYVTLGWRRHGLRTYRQPDGQRFCSRRAKSSLLAIDANVYLRCFLRHSFRWQTDLFISRFISRYPSFLDTLRFWSILFEERKIVKQNNSKPPAPQISPLAPQISPLALNTWRHGIRQKTLMNFKPLWTSNRDLFLVVNNLGK